MTQDTLDKALTLFSDKPIRTGDLIGAAHKAGLDDRAAWDAFSVLERDGRIRALKVPHAKMKNISVVAWILANKPTEADVSES